MRYLAEADGKRRTRRPSYWIILMVCCSLAGVLAFSWPTPAQAIRLKDVASFKGVRPNQLLGNGLVVGLNGSGDGTNVDFNVQELSNMLANMGITADRSKIQVKNIAAVAVTAVLPPFARVGSRLDVLVS